MRVRWALEEAGQPYDVRLVSFVEMKEPTHRALHPFGQIPTFEDGDLALFESGAIVFHIAERHGGLLPDDANGRAHAITWMFSPRSAIELASASISSGLPASRSVSIDILWWVRPTVKAMRVSFGVAIVAPKRAATSSASVIMRRAISTAPGERPISPLLECRKN